MFGKILNYCKNIKRRTSVRDTCTGSASFDTIFFKNSPYGCPLGANAR
ncbi:hypothetical protein SAMN04487773_3121 [Enterobacter sp. kpr-6]|nr:hypothetical protein SAMN04487773_3121 [Enterobacter sp. kpr-6]